MRILKFEKSLKYLPDFYGGIPSTIQEEFLSYFIRLALVIGHAINAPQSKIRLRAIRMIFDEVFEDLYANLPLVLCPKVYLSPCNIADILINLLDHLSIVLGFLL